MMMMMIKTIRSLELSFQVPWTFLAADHSFICQQSSTWSTYKVGTALYFTEFFRTVDILLLFIFHSRPSTFALKIIILRTQ